MSPLVVNVGIVLLFVLIGGFFAAAEIALVSLRESQVSQLAQRGGRGRAVRRLFRHRRLNLSLPGDKPVVAPPQHVQPPAGAFGLRVDARGAGG